MRLFPRPHTATQRQTLTGLGLILAAFANPVHAGWDCTQTAGGEWQCAGSGVTAVDRTVVDVDNTSFEPVSAPPAAAPTSTASNNTTTTTSKNTAAETTAAITNTNTTAALTDQGPDPKHITKLSDDWVPISRLPAAKKSMHDETAVTTELCCGTYVDPVAEHKGENPANALLNAHADTTETDISKQATTLKGDVQISQGYRYLRADSATLTKNPQQVILEGNIALREPDLLLLGDKATVQVDENTAEMTNAQYLMHKEHVHGSASSLSRSDTGVIAMTDANYSYCPVGSEQWLLKSRSLVLDPNTSEGHARDVTLRVKDVPVFYLPYLQFPLGDQRMSGFLTPSFTSGEDGVEIAAPYYLNLAPDYDLTLTPRIISDRGEMLGSQFRHMTAYTKSSITANIMPDDRLAVRSERWLLRAHEDGAAEHWENMLDFNAASDRHYFQDFGGRSFRESTSILPKQVEGSYLQDHWRIGAQAKNFQVLDLTLAEPHEVLPSVFANGTYALDNGAVFKLHQAITRFDHNDAGNLSKIPGVSYNLPQTETMMIAGQRLNVDYSVELPIRNASAFVTPKIGVRHVSQQLDQTTINTPHSNPSTTVGVASVDSGLVFERNSNWFGNTYRQTLEPRLFYYYAGKSNQDDIYNFDSNPLSFSYAQLFRDYRLAGEDYIDDANQVSAGISSRLLNPATGRELVRVGLGQSYYLDKRDVVLEPDAATAAYERQRSRSALVGEVAARLNQFWDIRSETLWNDDQAKRERQSLALRYRDDERRLFNVGYQFLDRPDSLNKLLVMTDRSVNQYYVSGAYPLNNQWSVIGHWNRDTTNNRNLETVAGFEYDSCCWSARVVARSWVVNTNFVDDISAQETDNGIFLEFQLKSLGNFGENNLERKLSSSIFGLEDRKKPLD